MIRQPQQIPETHDMVSSEHSLDLALRESAAAAATGPKKQNALKVLHRFLRGRYHWVVILSLVLGALGGYAGFKRGAKTYSSTGEIRINFVVPAILRNVDDATLQGADVYVEEQIKAMTSWKVISRAITNSEWLSVRPAAAASFTDQAATTKRAQDLLMLLKVAQKGNLIQVEARDVNPAVAAAAAHAVIGAFQAIYIDHEGGMPIDPRTSPLRDKQSELQKDLGKVREEIDAIAVKYGSERLDAHYSAKLTEVSTAERNIRELESKIAIVTKKLQQSGIDPTLPKAQVPPVLTPDALSVNDEELRILYSKLADAKNILDRAKRGSNVRALKEAEESVKSTQLEIDSRVAHIIEARDKGLSVIGVPPIQNQQVLDDLQTELDEYKPKYQNLMKELAAIGDQNLTLGTLHAKEDDIKSDLKDVTKRIDTLTLENPETRRLEVANPGEFPVMADKDTRPKYAAAGGFGGVFIGFAAVMAVGYLSATLKAPRDLQYDLDETPMLGVIPQLAKGAHATRLATMAAECVHRSRTMLEIWARGNGRMVIGVTSPSHGSGNTSVAMSLGVSFATAGLRTLLIDCDFVTNGLTPRLQTVVKRDLGKVLLRSGFVTESELEAARQHVAIEINGTAKDKDLGDACIKLGYMTPEEVEEAMAVQARDPVGVLDAMNGEPLKECVGRTGIRNLSILPRGNVTPAHAAKLSSHAMREVLATARQHYDTVIIDTSAILTSLEAGIVASSVDGMVMTVARGEKRTRLSEAMARLGTLHCPVAGVIFNQVLPSDMPPEPKIGRVSTVNNNELDEETIRAANLELVGRLAMLGPLATSMVSRVPVLDERKDWE